MMTKEEFQILLRKYADGECTESERATLETWYLHQDQSFSAALGKTTIELDVAEVYRRLPNPEKRVSALWPKLAVAAGIISILGLCVYIFNIKKDKSLEEQEVISHIQPGQVSATLTLSNGKKIILAQASTGTLARQTGVIVTKNSKGQLSYQIIPGSRADSTQLNTLSTVKGETYQAILPDGSRIWLNAASSVTYPANLAASSVRKVQLSGEAYFEVAKDPAHPFVVEIGTQRTRVLGTHFNIRGYADEMTILTTLLEGKIAISTKQVAKILIPGQQARNQTGLLTVADHADTEEAVAWKNGYFKFDGNLESAMSKIARWYDIEVVYHTKPDINVVLEGEISRSRKISEVLEILQKYGGDVHFELEGRKVIVTK